MPIFVAILYIYMYINILDCSCKFSTRRGKDASNEVVERDTGFGR